MISRTGLMYYYQGEQEDGVWFPNDGLYGLINSKNDIIVKPAYKHYHIYENRIIFFSRQSADFQNLDIEDGLTIHF